MSRFTTQLEVALENARLTRTELADACGINYRTLSNYATGRTPPDVEAVRLICAALPEEERAALLVARAADEIPLDYRHLVLLEERSPALREDAPAVYDAALRRLPAPVAEAIRALAEAAGENEEWKKAVLALADLVAPAPAHPPGAPAGLPPGWTPPPDTSLEHTPHPLEEGILKKAAQARPKPPVAP